MFPGRICFLNYPLIIQGGMGIGASTWRIARTVSMLGQLGVVSGVGLDTILARRLQNGDPEGNVRRALSHFPVPEIAEKILAAYYIPGGKPENSPYKFVPLHTVKSSLEVQELTVAANFVEIFLAKEGHEGIVGINYLEKIQLPNIPAFYGSMLAGVDYVIMGAGIPREIPGILDLLSDHKPFATTLQAESMPKDYEYVVGFDPGKIVSKPLPPLKRPKFLAIISSAALAVLLTKKATGKVDGFVIEGPTAGGHNAPPRGVLKLNKRGEPIYGPRDEVDLKGMRNIGLPFWLAGSFGGPLKLDEALKLGAAGIQVGTPFAFCNESGIANEIKKKIIRKALDGKGEVLTDPLASPSGFPFKVVEMEGSVSEKEIYEARPRICDLGYLRRTYYKENGEFGYRCPSEDVAAYLKKGGKLEDTIGRKCICNGLVATIGFPQVRTSGYREAPIVTAGDDLKLIARFAKADNPSYSAEDVIRYILDNEKKQDRLP
jgi:nitronate monooxygenase